MANPLVMTTWIMLWRRHLRTALCFSVVAFVLAISFFEFNEVPYGIQSSRVNPNLPQGIVSYGPGFWLWLLSIASAIPASFFSIFRKNAT